MAAGQQQPPKVSPGSNCLGKCVEHLTGSTEVPNFAKKAFRSSDRGEPKTMLEHLDDWAIAKGYAITTSPGSLSETSSTPVILLAPTSPGGKGPGHAVVAKEGRIIFDPLDDYTYSATFPFDKQISIT